MQRPRRILVFRTGHLGDTVCAIPAFRLIRNFFPGTNLSLLCDRPGHADRVPAAEVTRNLGIFDGIESYESGGVFSAWGIFRAVRKIRPDLVIVLPQVREDVETVRFKRRFFRRLRVPDVRAVQISTSHHEWQPNEPARLIHVLETIGISGKRPDYMIPVNVTARLTLEKKLQMAGVKQGRPLLIFCGGGKASTQCWPLDRYATVLKRVADEIDLEVLALGTRDENARFRSHVVPIFPNLRILPEPLTTDEMFEVFRMTFCYVGNDTGPMHVAAAMGCPVVAIISARNSPGSWDPDTSRKVVIRHRTECEDCFLIDCVVERHRCMTSITVERVVEEALPFIQKLGAGSRESQRSEARDRGEKIEGKCDEG